MSDFNLQVNYREKKGKGYRKQLSHKDMVPGVVYGKTVGSIPIELEYKPLRQILIHGRNSIIDLTITGPGADNVQNYKVLIKDLQHDPIKRDLMNIDFHQISMDDAIQTNMPINFIGDIKDGILQYGLRELQISCLPTDIPRQISLNLDGLTVGNTVTVKDIVLPNNVSVLDDQDAMVVTVMAHRKEEEPAGVEDSDGDAENSEAEKVAE